MPHRRKLGPGDKLPDFLTGAGGHRENLPAAPQPTQGSLFDRMRETARKVDTKSYVDDTGTAPPGVDVNSIKDPHFIPERDKVQKQICMSCNYWVLPGCCSRTRDFAYGKVSLRVTSWDHTCEHWREIIKPTFPGGHKKRRVKKNSYREWVK
jgi:hypothetical protein